MNTLTPWEKIVRAANRNTGLTLTADEVYMLRMDDAIVQAAENEREKREATQSAKDSQHE